MHTRKTCFTLLCIWLISGMAFSQTAGETKEMRTLKLRLQEATLKLERSEAQLQKAETSLKEARSLYDKELTDKNEVSHAEDEYNNARLGRDQATIDLEKTRLDFLNDALAITLEKAAVYRDAKGNKHVSIEVRNSSNINKIIDEQSTYTIENKKALLRIENLGVAIKLNNNYIGKPFVIRIPTLSYNDTVAVDFLLQKETDQVVVNLSYANREFNFPVYLEKESREDRITIEANQFSQEGALGGKVLFDLSLERLVEDDKMFTLCVVNLPKQYIAEFLENNVTVSRIRFKKETTTKSIRLVISMPQELPNELIDKKVAFMIVVLDNEGTKKMAGELQGDPVVTVRPEQLDKERLSYSLLELTPRGRAEMTIAAQNLFYKVPLGQNIQSSFSMENAGTVALEKVRVKLTLPDGWAAHVTPEKEIVLDVYGKQKIDAVIVPPPTSTVGDFEAKIESFTTYQGREVRSEPKTLRIQIEGKPFLVWILSGSSIILVGMVAIYVRHRRKARYAHPV